MWWWHDLRRTAMLRGLKIFLVCLLFLTSASFGLFAASYEDTVGESYPGRGDMQIVTIIDTYNDSTAFNTARSDTELMQQVSQFYDDMKNSSEGILLSAFSHPVVVANFRGGDHFDAHRDSGDRAGEYVDPEYGINVRDVRAMQMNQHAFEFYGMGVETGSAPDWDTVDYASGAIPVVLGADYQGIYAVGDTLESWLYFSPVELQVVGFLPSGATMFHLGDPYFLLDDRIIIPYPPVAGDLDVSSESVQILLFAMINSDFAAPADWEADQVVNTIRREAVTSGFTDFTVSSMPLYQWQHEATRVLVRANAFLVTGVVLAIATLAVVALGFLQNLMAAARRPLGEVLWLVGHDRSGLLAVHRAGAVVDWGVTAVISCGVAYMIFPSFTLPLLIVLGGAFLGLLVELGVSTSRVTRRLTHVPGAIHV